MRTPTALIRPLNPFDGGPALSRDAVGERSANEVGVCVGAVRFQWNTISDTLPTAAKIRSGKSAEGESTQQCCCDFFVPFAFSYLFLSSVRLLGCHGRTPFAQKLLVYLKKTYFKRK